jgi:hypothetical protein
MIADLSVLNFASDKDILVRTIMPDKKKILNSLMCVWLVHVTCPEIGNVYMAERKSFGLTDRFSTGRCQNPPGDNFCSGLASQDFSLLAFAC